MIRVNVNTLVADREPVPASAAKLDSETLRNLQTELVPVPDYLDGYEWWPEDYTAPVYDEGTQKLGAEILTPVAEAKIVSSTHAVEPMTAEEIAAYNAKVSEELAQQEAQLQKTYTDAIQKMMDAEAQSKNYDGILSVCSYATSTNAVFKAEAAVAVPWRDAVWSAGYKILADVKAGLRPLPTIEEMLAELPVINWP